MIFHSSLQGFWSIRGFISAICCSAINPSPSPNAAQLLPYMSLFCRYSKAADSSCSTQSPPHFLIILTRCLFFSFLHLLYPCSSATWRGTIPRCRSVGHLTIHTTLQPYCSLPSAISLHRSASSSLAVITLADNIENKRVFPENAHPDSCMLPSCTSAPRLHCLHAENLLLLPIKTLSRSSAAAKHHHTCKQQSKQKSILFFLKASVRCSRLLHVHSKPRITCIKSLWACTWSTHESLRLHDGVRITGFSWASSKCF